MKTTGIVLIVLQLLALFGSIVNGSLLEMFSHGGVRTIGNLIGFFCLGIIGIILIVLSTKKKANVGEAEETN